MNGSREIRFDPARLERTPAFVVDEGLLRANAEILAHVRRETDCRILLALKCFSMFRVFPLLAEYLDGVCASSPHEARLGREEFAALAPGKEVHTFAAGYSEAEIRELARTSDHLVFNSLAQLKRFAPLARSLARSLPRAEARDLVLAIRINPEHSEGAVPLYDPCAPGSRLGIRRAQLDAGIRESGSLEALFAGDAAVAGLHWHNLCEQDADNLERTLRAVEARFADLLPRMRYVNFGGGHHITRPGYDVPRLVELIRAFQTRWNVRVYLEPGEAVALNAGWLVSSVLDVVPAEYGSGQGVEMAQVIMDSAVPCHMPDVIEMPYRPHVLGSGEPGEKAWTCRIGGPSCLAGDVAGEYSFDAPLKPGDRLVFTDMAIYTMVKTNTFNGIRLPDMLLYRPDTDVLELVRRFGYEDFRQRLS
ncbi:MAG: carboxynorspermidine decarboxylase [Desulfovibrio sp.]